MGTGVVSVTWKQDLFFFSQDGLPQNVCAASLMQREPFHVVCEFYESLKVVLANPRPWDKPPSNICRAWDKRTNGSLCIICLIFKIDKASKHLNKTCLSSFLDQHNFIMAWKGQNLNFSEFLEIHPEHGGMGVASSWFPSSFPILLPPSSPASLGLPVHACGWPSPHGQASSPHPHPHQQCLGHVWGWWIRELAYTGPGIGPGSLWAGISTGLGTHWMIKGCNLQGPPLLSGV